MPIFGELGAQSFLYARCTKDGKPKGRSIPGRPSRYLFSSLLHCGVCGDKMVISGGNSSTSYYRCEGHSKRGTCKNALSVRETDLRASLLNEIRRRLASDQGLAYARKQVAILLGKDSRRRNQELVDAENRLTTLEREIDQLVQFVADGNGSKAVAGKLKTIEANADLERRKIKSLEQRTEAPIRLPTPEEVLQIVFDLEARLTADVGRGREELRRLFRDGRIDLIPQPGGFYVAKSALLPLVLLVPRPLGEGAEGRSIVSRYSASSCAGRI